MIHNLHKFFYKNYTPVGHGVKAAGLQGDYPVRDPGQVQQPEGEGLATQVGEDGKLPPRTLHKQDPQARTGGQQHELTKSCKHTIYPQHLLHKPDIILSEIK